MPYPYLNDARKEKIRRAVAEVEKEILDELKAEALASAGYEPGDFVDGLDAMYEIQDFLGDFAACDDHIEKP